MARKTLDNSPRFDRVRSYAIGSLMNGASVVEVPDKFSMKPVKPLYYSGSDLIGSGMKSCRDFLISSSCPFRDGRVVQFYEVEYSDENETPVYKNIYSGTPLPQPALNMTQQSLSDGFQSKDGHIINNIIPNNYSSEHEKMLFKTQNEAIAFYQKCLQDERSQFANERIVYTTKIEGQKDEILELNLRINNLLHSGSEQGQKVLDRNKYLEMFGIDGKEYDQMAVAYPSVLIFGKNEVIGRRECFRGHNIDAALPNLEFPLKTHALEIDTIRVDVDINFDADKQKSLELERYFLQNSVLCSKLNRVDGIIIPLEHCVPQAIEYDGENYTKKVIRNGFKLPAPIQVNMGGNLAIAIDPGSGFKTDATSSNPDPLGANRITVTLIGRSITPRIQS